MDNASIEAWTRLSPQEKRSVFEETARRMGLPVAAAAEKDWWVVLTLKLIFETEISDCTVFKGGTSLSKAWNLIDRFSEDIDLAIDRKFLGFDKEMTGSQVRKLRRESCNYISNGFLADLQGKFKQYGFTDTVVRLIEIKSHDEDPVQIEIFYTPVTEQYSYLPSRVLIETGCRSLIEPFTERNFSTFVGAQFNESNFADKGITIPAVNPERTFLEKIFLLHEEFQQPPEKIKVARKSRHLYDLEKIMDTKYGRDALLNTGLYNHIVEHRMIMTPVRGIDYSNHVPGKINPLPPEGLMDEWKRDYAQMQQSMIYRDSLPFKKLIQRISELKHRINSIANG